MEDHEDSDPTTLLQLMLSNSQGWTTTPGMAAWHETTAADFTAESN